MLTPPCPPPTLLPHIAEPLPPGKLMSHRPLVPPPPPWWPISLPPLPPPAVQLSNELSPPRPPRVHLTPSLPVPPPPPPPPITYTSIHVTPGPARCTPLPGFTYQSSRGVHVDVCAIAKKGRKSTPATMILKVLLIGRRAYVPVYASCRPSRSLMGISGMRDTNNAHTKATLSGGFCLYTLLFRPFPPSFWCVKHQ